MKFSPLRGWEKDIKKGNKGNSEKPFVYWCLAGALRARVSEDLKYLYARCDVCVKTFSEICKYKALKDAREMEFFCMPLLRLFIFAFVVIFFNRSDPHPPNLGGEGDERGDRNCQNRGKDK